MYTAAWLPHLEEVVAAVVAALSPTCIVLRLSRNCQDVAQKEFRLSDGQMLLGAPVTAPVPFLENGIRFEADVISGQKTGTGPRPRIRSEKKISVTVIFTTEYFIVKLPNCVSNFLFSGFRNIGRAPIL